MQTELIDSADERRLGTDRRIFDDRRKDQLQGAFTVDRRSGRDRRSGSDRRRYRRSIIKL